MMVFYLGFIQIFDLFGRRVKGSMFTNENYELQVPVEFSPNFYRSFRELHPFASSEYAVILVELRS